METGLNHLHSALRYVLLILLIVSTVNAWMKWKKATSFSALDNKLSLSTFALSHIQLVLGFALYALFMMRIQDHGAIMGDSVLRFYAVEHIFGMLIGIVLISIGRIKSKKASDDTAKHKTIAIYYLIALIIILASIPWPFRGLGNGWF